MQLQLQIPLEGQCLCRRLPSNPGVYCLGEHHVNRIWLWTLGHHAEPHQEVRILLATAWSCQTLFHVPRGLKGLWPDCLFDLFQGLPPLLAFSFLFQAANPWAFWPCCAKSLLFQEGRLLFQECLLFQEGTLLFQGGNFFFKKWLGAFNPWRCRLASETYEV